MARLTNYQWAAIVKLYKKGITITRLARDYGVARETVHYQLRKRAVKKNTPSEQEGA